MEHLLEPLSTKDMRYLKDNRNSELGRFISRIIKSDDYLRSVELAADLKASHVIKNSGAKHGTIVMSNIFRTAQTYVYIFAGGLKGEVSTGEYLNELKKYLQKPNSILRVILEREPPVHTPAIKEIIEELVKRPEEIKLGWLKNSETRESYQSHFTISDDRMFRKEIDVKNYIAIASFNDPKTVAELKEQFFKMDVEYYKL